MKLKQYNKKPIPRFWQNRAYYIAILLIFFTGYTCVTFLTGVILQHTELIPAGLVKETVILAKTAMNPVKLIIARLKANPEKIYIDIEHKDFQKIAYNRNVALSRGLLITSGEDYVSAKIRHGGKTYKAKLRLKGDLRDHWDTEKWSLRIKIKGDNTLLGMKAFSIQNPSTRFYISEWLALEALRREGLIAVRYKFVDVTINGKHKGIYALEEHFDKRLIESNRNREGSILKFNEEAKWMEYLLHQTDEIDYGTWTSSFIDSYNKTDTQNTLAIKAATLLEAFRSGDLKTTQVFDSNKLAFFIAFKDLIGSEDLDWNDLRFYYNPITSKLEPIGFDTRFTAIKIDRLFSYNGGIKWKMADYIQNPSGIVPKFFADQDFWPFYLQALNKISAPRYLDALLETLKPELGENLEILRSEYPFIKLPIQELRNNIEFIQKTLDPPKAIQAYVSKSGPDFIDVEVANIQSLPIKLLNISYKNNYSLIQYKEMVLNPKVSTNLADYQTYRFMFPADTLPAIFNSDDLKIHYTVFGLEKITSVKISPWPRMDNALLANDALRQHLTIEHFPFLSVEESTRKIVILPGYWNIDSNLIIPKGYHVICSPATVLRLVNSSSFISFSPVQFVGSEESPIVIVSETGDNGKGFAVIESTEKSTLRNVIFRNLANPSQSGWALTGSVTFYKSPVEISNCQFLSNKSEDSLNIVSSEFSIKNSFFQNTFSDAFDADFSNGIILNSTFEKCGNDGIDISGSIVTVENVIMSLIGDKGLSAGENSQMEVKNFTITDAEIGITSKDMSEVSIVGMTTINSKIGLTAYQKKPEFGPGKISIRKLSISGSKIPFLVEKNSTLTVDGKPVDGARTNVENILYGAQYGKSSK